MNWIQIKKDLLSRDIREAGLAQEEVNLGNIDIRLVLRIAEFLRRRRRFEECDYLMETVSKRSDLSDDEKATWRYFRADILFDQGLYAAASLVYTEMLSEKTSAVAYNNRGLCFWEMKEFGKALKDYRRAACLDPSDPIAQRGIGEMLVKLCRFREAIRYLCAAIKLDPSYSEALTTLGVAFYRVGKWADAYEVLKKALVIDPGNKVARLGLEKLRRDPDIAEEE